MPHAKGNLARGLEAIVEVFKESSFVPKAFFHTWRGRFDIEQLKRTGTKLPAVCIANVAGDLKVEGGVIYSDAQIVAYVVADGHEDPRRTNPSRTEVCEVIVEGLLDQLHPTRWRNIPDTGVCVSPPREVAYTNNFTTKGDEAGIAVWLVAWKQRIEHKGIDAATLEDFNTLFVTMEQAELHPDAAPDPNEDLEQEIDLTP